MFNKNLILSVSLLMGTACATPSADHRKLDADVRAEPTANTPDAIAERGAHAFIDAPGLSDGQKEKLLGVFNQTYASAMTIRKDIGQSKSLLFKLVASKDFKSKEVEDLKKRIVDLDQKRIKIMFKALADVQAIVGTGDDKEEIYKHFYDFEYPKSTVTQR
jgi:hypothetical protein